MFELADLAALVLPDEDLYLVPLPTIERHKRERGFDHIALLARKLAGANRRLKIANVLERGSNHVQVGASALKRKTQAKTAYIAREKLVDVNCHYVLLDDVWTTGSSILAARKEMLRAGARSIDVFVIAKSGKLGRDATKSAKNEADDSV